MTAATTARAGRLHRSSDGLPPGPSVVTIGQFDGVHRGHRRLVAEAVRRADRLGLPAGAVTFDRHPAAVLAPAREPPALTGLDEKADLLIGCGVDFVLALPVSADLLRTTAADFVGGLLATTLGCRSVVVGANFRFGHRAAGDPALLAELGRPHGIDVVVADLLDIAGGPVSSTRIRAEIAAGRARSAAALLGRPHRVGAVVTGAGSGTATARLDPGALWPGDGRYRVSVEVDGRPGQLARAQVDARYPARVTLELPVGTAPAHGARLRIGLLTELG